MHGFESNRYLSNGPSRILMHLLLKLFSCVKHLFFYCKRKYNQLYVTKPIPICMQVKRMWFIAGHI